MGKRKIQKENYSIKSLKKSPEFTRTISTKRINILNYPYKNNILKQNHNKLNNSKFIRRIISIKITVRINYKWIKYFHLKYSKFRLKPLFDKTLYKNKTYFRKVPKIHQRKPLKYQTIKSCYSRNLGFLNALGIVKVGVWVEQNQVLALRVRTVESQTFSQYERLYYDILELKKPIVYDNSLRVHTGTIGRVVFVKSFFSHELSRTRYAYLEKRWEELLNINICRVEYNNSNYFIFRIHN